jgi:hypothetical protein
MAQSVKGLTTGSTANGSKFDSRQGRCIFPFSTASHPLGQLDPLPPMIEGLGGECGISLPSIAKVKNT